MNEQQFIEALKEKGIVLTDSQIAQFKKYFELLVEWNEKMNLTAITDLEGVYLKHFYDSISASFYFDFTKENSIGQIILGIFSKKIHDKRMKNISFSDDNFS